MTEQEASFQRLKEPKPTVMTPDENHANHLHVVCAIDDLEKALESLIKGWNDYEFTVEWRLKNDG